MMAIKQWLLLLLCVCNVLFVGVVMLWLLMQHVLEQGGGDGETASSQATARQQRRPAHSRTGTHHVVELVSSNDKCVSFLGSPVDGLPKFRVILKKTAFFFQRLSVLIHCFNAVLLHNCFVNEMAGHSSKKRFVAFLLLIKFFLFIGTICSEDKKNNSNESLLSYVRMLKTWHCPHLLLHAVLQPRAAAAPAVQQSKNGYALK